MNVRRGDRLVFSATSEKKNLVFSATSEEEKILCVVPLLKKSSVVNCDISFCFIQVHFIN